MLFTIFTLIFVGGFFAIAALGHILLLTAVWPEIFGKDEPDREAPDGVSRTLRPYP